MRKKHKKKTVTPAPIRNKNEYVVNPVSQTPSFGTFPRIDSKGIVFLEGEIYLKYGEHRGPNRGFGMEHIWAEHQDSLISNGYTDQMDVARYVSDIIKPNASIHSEFAEMRNKRVQIVKSAVGMVILEERLDGYNTPIYSVVTAYLGKAQGPKIGAL
jgi:hypothetical protein